MGPLVLEAMEVLWKESAASIENQACEILNVKSLRDYLRKPAGFFADHLKNYSKSRRKAPIYWPLATSSGRYTVWVYYPRLTADTLYKIVAEHVGPKMAKCEDRIAQLQGRQGGNGAGVTPSARRELTDLDELLAELKLLKEELLRVAKLPYKPDLDDGVEINAAPLFRCFRQPKWRSDLEITWKALECEEYEWSHLAYGIWPERVKEKCKTDKSLAIAHGLEALYEEPARESEGAGTRRQRARAGSGRGRHGR